MFCRSFHRIAHRRDVRVEAHPGVLDIEDQRVQTCKHRIGGPHVISVKAINRQARGRICRGCDAFVHDAANPVLRAEQGHEFHTRRMCKQINRASAVAINPRLVCNESDAFPSQRREVLRLKHVNARHRMSIAAREL